MFVYLTDNPSFWLTVILITTAIIAKDLYLSGLERNFNYKPFHILQEVQCNLNKPMNLIDNNDGDALAD
jgi:hypothetical protein